VKTWDRDGWTEASSIPGCATIIPAGMPTDWLVDGELDAVTLSIPPDVLAGQPHADRFDKMRFAFADPLGVALTRQILSELYAPQTEERTAYIAAMANALKAHILSGPPAHGNPVDLPVSDFSAYRLHQIMNAVLADPAQEHSLEQMAMVAGVTPSHFCRLFKKAMGISPHQYVMQARLDRAQQMLVQTNLSLATLSEMAGFASQSHFSRAFRARFGMAPSDYRQQERRGAH
jgi:AraC family transcriptional regulator